MPVTQKTTITVCRRCFHRLRRCGKNCTMGGWVHSETERHLCNPMYAWMLLKYPETFPGMSNLHHFAYPLRITVCRTIRTGKKNAGLNADVSPIGGGQFTRSVTVEAENLSGHSIARLTKTG